MQMAMHLSLDPQLQRSNGLPVFTEGFLLEGDKCSELDQAVCPMILFDYAFIASFQAALMRKLELMLGLLILPRYSSASEAASKPQ